MDENTWKFAQIMMWLIGIQSSIIIGIIGTMWTHFNSKIYETNKEIFLRMD